MELISGDICGCYLCADHVKNWPSGITEEEQQEIIDKVEQIIDKVTETKWCGEAFDIKLNGNNKNRLFLPLETDIITVTHVYIACIELDSTWYTWDVNSIYLDPCIGDSMWGTNAVEDGDFYSWTSTTDLDYWIESFTPGASTINRDRAQTRVGNYCVRLDIDSSGTAASIEQGLSLLRNRTYRLQFYYKNTAIQKTGVTFPALADSATTTTLRDVSVFDTDNEFNNCYVEIKSGKGTDNGPVKIINTIAATGDIVVAAWPGTQPDNTSRYDILGTLKVKLYNPAASADITPAGATSLTRKITAGITTWIWQAGNNFISQLTNDVFAPSSAWTLFTAEFTSHSDFIVYDLVFENDSGQSFSIYIDNVGILSAGIAAIASDLTEGIFPRGYNNIWVKGVMCESGVIPEAIKQAAVVLARWENDPTLYTYTGLKKSEKIGDYSYTNLATTEADVLTGIAEADFYLRLYVKRKPVLMAP